MLAVTIVTSGPALEELVWRLVLTAQASVIESYKQAHMQKLTHQGLADPLDYPYLHLLPPTSDNRS